MFAILAGAFLPDLLWIGLSAANLEPSAPAVFFDGWSHSLLSITLQATLFALLFMRKGVGASLPVWLAVMSHFVLDVLIHPKPIELYPHSAAHAPWDLWRWGAQHAALSFSHYWWVQLAFVFVLLALYVAGAQRASFPLNLLAATVLLVIGLHLLF